MAENESKIEWDESEPGFYNSMCGRFTLMQDQTYDYFHLHRASDDELIAQGSMGEMTKVAARQPIETAAA